MLLSHQVPVRKHHHEPLETIEVTSFVSEMSEGDCKELNKAAKSSETMAFDCPLVCPEILEGLQVLWKSSTQQLRKMLVF